MSEKITAIIDSNRKLTVSMTDGYAGEHNAQLLEINIGPFAQGYDYYILNFDNYRFKGNIASNVISTSEDRPAYIVNGMIYCPLTAQLTCTGRLRIQLEAHKKVEDGGEIVRKSSVATVEFKASIMGDEDMMDNKFSLYGRLEELEKKVDELGQNTSAVTEIPVAGEEKLGAVKYNHFSEVVTDESGNLMINYQNVNGYRLSVLLVLSLFGNNYNVKCFTAVDGTVASQCLLDYSMAVLSDEYKKVFFVTWNTCSVYYYDENFSEQMFTAKSDMLYCYYLKDGIATIEPYEGDQLRMLITEGV